MLQRIVLTCPNDHAPREDEQPVPGYGSRDPVSGALPQN